MSRITFDKPVHDALSRALMAYVNTELDAEASPLAAGLLLDFIAETIGPHFYNQGVRDAQALFREKVEAVVETVYEIERPARI